MDGVKMTKITPDALIGARVIEVDREYDHIVHIVLEDSDGRLVELCATHDFDLNLQEDGDAWIEVL